MTIFTDSLAFGLGGTELYIILGVVLLLFGGKKIPELMRGVGQGVGQLQKGLDEGKRTLNTAIAEESAVEKAEHLPAVAPTQPVAVQTITDPANKPAA